MININIINIFSSIRGLLVENSIYRPNATFLIISMVTLSSKVFLPLPLTIKRQGRLKIH